MSFQQKISIHVLAGIVNKRFLFGASSHVVQSQITLLVWPCLSHTEKQRTINHMIIFIDIQSVSFPSSAFEAFAEPYLCFLQSASAKKKKEEIAQAMKFLGIFKKYVSKNKIYFCLKKKAMFCLSHDFQTRFNNADHLLYYPQMSVFSFHPFFVLLYQFLRNG